MICVLFVNVQVIFAATALMPSAMAMLNMAILHRTAPTRFLHQKHHATKTDLVQGIDTPPTKGTDHISLMVPDIGDILADHSPTTSPTTTETAVLEGTLYAPLLATAVIVPPFS